MDSKENKPLVPLPYTPSLKFLPDQVNYLQEKKSEWAFQTSSTLTISLATASGAFPGSAAALPALSAATAAASGSFLNSPFQPYPLGLWTIRPRGLPFFAEQSGVSQLLYVLCQPVICNQ